MTMSGHCKGTKKYPCTENIHGYFSKMASCAFLTAERGGILLKFCRKGRLPPVMEDAVAVVEVLCQLRALKAG